MRENIKKTYFVPYVDLRITFLIKNWDLCTCESKKSHHPNLYIHPIFISLYIFSSFEYTTRNNIEIINLEVCDNFRSLLLQTNYSSQSFTGIPWRWMKGSMKVLAIT